MRTVVPPSGVGSISTVPPTAAARSRMLCSPIIVAPKPLERESDPVVFDHEHEGLAALLQQDVHRLGLGVLGDVVQRFLADAIHARFQFRREAHGVMGSRMKRGPDAGVPRPLLDVRVHDPGEAEFIQRRRSQLPREEIDTPVDTRQHAERLGERLDHVPAVARIRVECLEGEPERGQSLSQIVVQVAGEAPTLLFLYDHETTE